MVKKFIFILILCNSFLFAQKIKIVDAETFNAISNARIISANNVYYSNDDGFVLLPEISKNLVISAYGYETLKNPDYNTVLKLKPLYNQIDGVKIVSIDFQKILKEVADNYSDIYYNKPIIYDVEIKQKSFENQELKVLMIADGKFWSKNGMYNAKDAFNDKFDNFVQLQIDNLRYLKTEPSQNFVREKKPKISHDNIGDLFLHYELWRTHRLSKIKNAKISGKLINENGDDQEISFSIKADSSYAYNGKFIYNKKDKAITHFELDFTQNKSEPSIYKDENGKEFKRQLGNGIIIFDYYKRDDKYFPSKISFITKGFKTITENQTFEYSSSRDVIFKSFETTDKKALENPVKINQPYWTKLKISDDKGNVLLTNEEQKFINDKNININKKDNED